MNWMFTFSVRIVVVVYPTCERAEKAGLLELFSSVVLSCTVGKANFYVSFLRKNIVCNFPSTKVIGNFVHPAR